MKSPSERLSESLTKGNLWIYILKILEKQDVYPYQINDMIEKRFDFRPGNVTAYIVMKKLEAGGFVTISHKSKQAGPQRSHYHITEKGKKELVKARKIIKGMPFIYSKPS